MTPAAALDLAEAALRRGMCPPARHADKGCQVCDDTLAAIEALRARFKPTEAERRWADASASLARNGVWGTCVDCPDAEGRVYGQRRGPTLPECCPNFARYDHRLTAEELERSIATERWNCPACPKCKLRCGTRAGGWVSVGVARDRGVEWLACSACGHVWHAEGEELAQAARADRAWLREREAERVPRRAS